MQYLMIAGAVAGAVGLGIGLKQMNSSSRKNFKSMRRNAAWATTIAAQKAGDAITGLGVDLANKIR